jgi:DNA-binding transcriptional regulator LsrR (DeoR family)
MYNLPPIANCYGVDMASQELLLRVAKLKFEDGSNNSEIAEILLKDGTLETESTAQRRVSELVEEAGQWLLDRHKLLFGIEGDKTIEQELGRQLCSKFGLLDARVVPGGEYTPRSTMWPY